MRWLIPGERKSEYPPFEFAWRRPRDWTAWSAFYTRKVTCWGFAKMLPPPSPCPAPLPCCASSLRLPACTSLDGTPPSLDGLLVGCAARVLRLHDVGELRGGGERLDPQLLERVIWEGGRNRWTGRGLSRPKPAWSTHQSGGTLTPPWPGPEAAPSGSWSHSFLKSVRRSAANRPGETRFRKKITVSCQSAKAPLHKNTQKERVAKL